MTKKYQEFCLSTLKKHLIQKNGTLFKMYLNALILVLLLEMGVNSL